MSVRDLVAAHIEADKAIAALRKELAQYDDSDDPYPPLLKQSLDALLYLAAQTQGEIERDPFPERIPYPLPQPYIHEPKPWRPSDGPWCQQWKVKDGEFVRNDGAVG